MALIKTCLEIIASCLVILGFVGMLLAADRDREKDIHMSPDLSTDLYDQSPDDDDSIHTI